MASKARGICRWVNPKNELYVAYHNEEWGVPSHDDRYLFELLILEGAQAGLSWETILKKRAAYQQAYQNFDPHTVAMFTARAEARLLENPGIVRNRLKVSASVTNARAFVKIQSEFGSFANYLWEFTGGKPVQNRYRGSERLPATSALSDQISKDLKRRGFRFVGSTIIYAYLQAVGVVNDHELSCHRYKAVQTLAMALKSK